MKVFLSHSPRDAGLARDIAGGLRREGLAVWLADEEIFPGDNWAERVSQALKECDAMVALITPDAGASSNVQWELGFAMGNKAYRKRVIPVLVGDDTHRPPGNVPWILERFRVVRLDSSGDTNKAIQEIAESLAAAAV